MKYNILALAVACALAAGAAQAQTATEKALEARVAALEAALKSALDAMSAGAAAQASTAARAEPAQTSAAAALGKSVAAIASGVEVYGNVNVGVVRSEVAGVVTTTMNNMNTGSKIGFKGQRALGVGPVDAVYGQIEWSLDTSDGTANAGLSSREGWVGLKTIGGDLAYGRGKSAYTKALESAGAGFDVSTVFDFSNGNTGYSTGGVNMNRWANDIRYGNNFGPVAVRLDYALDEKGTDGQGGKKLGGSTIYKWGEKGRLTLAFLQMNNVSTVNTTATVNTAVCTKPTTATTCTTTSILTPNALAGLATPGNNNRAWVAGVKERFFGVDFSLAYQLFNRTTGADGVNSTDQSSMIGGVGYQLNNRQRVAFAFDKKSNTKVNSVETAVTAANTTYGLLYNFALDKKTDLRIEYTRLIRDNGAAGNVKIGTGLFYEF